VRRDVLESADLDLLASLAVDMARQASSAPRDWAAAYRVSAQISERPIVWWISGMEPHRTGNRDSGFCPRSTYSPQLLTPRVIPYENVGPTVARRLFCCSCRRRVISKLRTKWHLNSEEQQRSNSNRHDFLGMELSKVV
jgi:hypothetical protein